MSGAVRWTELVRARLGAIRKERERAGLATELWNATRAKRFAARLGIADRTDPLLRALVAERARQYLDIGAGTGRYAIALARAGRHVSAVEPSAGMRAELARHETVGLKVIDRSWPGPLNSAVDVAFSANVLFLVEDPLPFLEAMSASARGACVLSLAVVNSDAAIDPLWRMFHADRVPPSPTYLDAVGLLEELGERPVVRVALAPAPRPWRTIAAASADLAETVVVPNDPAARRRLRRGLERWLVRSAVGFESPLGRQAVALIRWAPARRPAAARKSDR